MGMKYTKIPTDTFKKIQLNAGVLVGSFTPATGEYTNLLGATTGGNDFKAEPSYTDFGDDIDNCPKNMMELKKLESWAVGLQGTFVTVSTTLAKRLVGAADIDSQDDKHVIPRNELIASDFSDLWWVGDYSDENTGSSAGFIAIHMLNTLNTAGFEIKSTDKGKGQFAFEFTGHYSMNDQDKVPFEIYIKEGTSSETPSVLLNKHAVSIATQGTETLTATTVPADATVTWSSGNSSVASVSDGTITAGSSAGNTIITASITKDGVTYNDTCTVIVVGGA